MAEDPHDGPPDEGGDPACWAHLFDEEEPEAEGQDTEPTGDP